MKMWKMDMSSNIHKGDKTTYPNNFRPMQSQSCLSIKMFEMILFHQVSLFVEETHPMLLLMFLK